jgi:MFS family permease
VGGYGFSLRATSFLYFTPIVALILGEAFGHWFNDFIANRYIKKHHGLFVPEVRLWPNYLAVAFMIPGLVLTGQALQFKWSYGVIIIGWGMYVFGVMICSVCTTAYILDCYPNAAGEVMGFMNLARVMGGFSVGYYQQQWGMQSGFNVSFGIQAVVVAAALGIVVLLQIFGKSVRHKAGPVKLGW